MSPRELSPVSDEGGDANGIGRVVETVRATGDEVKSRTADLRMTIVDHGQAAQPLTVNMLIDSGVYRTLLLEKDWQRVQAGGNGKKPKLKSNDITFRPYGPSQPLVVLGRSKCTLTAGGGAEVNTFVYVVRGAKESLLGLRDGEARE